MGDQAKQDAHEQLKAMTPIAYMVADKDDATKAKLNDKDSTPNPWYDIKKSDWKFYSTPGATPGTTPGATPGATPETSMAAWVWILIIVGVVALVAVLIFCLLAGTLLSFNIRLSSRFIFNRRLISANNKPRPNKGTHETETQARRKSTKKRSTRKRSTRP